MMAAMFPYVTDIEGDEELVDALDEGVDDLEDTVDNPHA